MPSREDIQETPQVIEERRQVVISYVANGVENNYIECKRSFRLRTDNKEDQLTFVRLLQAVSNTSRNSEAYIVFGADAKERAFYSIDNEDDFDPSRVTALISKYLKPAPAISIYPHLSTDDGKRFALMVISAEQDRPICIAKEGQSGGIHLRRGEVWVKTGTAICLANREDFDSMYEAATEAKSEELARKRFAYFREEAELNQHSVRQDGPPTKDLLVGPRRELIHYFLRSAESAPYLRVEMLLEMLRDLLVTEWSKEVSRAVPPEHFSDYMSNVLRPTLVAMAELGMTAIKHRLPHSFVAGLVAIIKEHFEITSKLFEKGLLIRAMADAGLPVWLTCMDCFAVAKMFAIYAISRERPDYLPDVQRVSVTKFTDSLLRFSTPTVPLLFVPFSLQNSPKEIGQMGILKFLWEHFISEHFASYFISVDDYEENALKHETVLELNSFLLMGMAPVVRESKPAESHLNYTFLPDLWRWPSNQSWRSLDWVYKKVMSESPGNPDDLMLTDGFWAHSAPKLRRPTLARFVYNTRREMEAMNMAQRRFFFEDFGVTEEMSALYQEGKELVEAD